jgi:CDGSH-type Zn-finger protein
LAASSTVWLDICKRQWATKTKGKKFNNSNVFKEQSIIFFSFKAPTKYQMTVQRCGDSWHIPFSNETHANPVSTFEMPENWLCAIANSDKQ